MTICIRDTALIIIDMINDFHFDKSDQLFKFAYPAAIKIMELKEKVTSFGIPTIYVNDNFKNWQGDFRELVSFCQKEHCLGKPIVELLLPKKDDYHILKPSYSGFYATPLHLLLEYLQVHTLILTGIAGNMCVQFTANDAFMHHYHLYVPSDCVASNDFEANETALLQMKNILKANIDPSDTLTFQT